MQYRNFINRILEQSYIEPVAAPVFQGVTSTPSDTPVVSSNSGESYHTNWDCYSNMHTGGKRAFRVSYTKLEADDEKGRLRPL